MLYTVEGLFDKFEKKKWMNALFESNLYVGETVSLFDKEIGKGSYLSNNYVTLPFHCCSWLEDSKFLFKDEEVDFAIYSSEEEVPTLTPATMHYKVEKNHQFTLPSNITNCAWLSPHVFEIEYVEDLSSGDSGSVVEGCIELEERGHAGKFCKLRSALWIIIARKKDDHKKGLALCLPFILETLRAREVYPELLDRMRSEIHVQLTSEWELITIEGEMNRTVRAMTVEARNMGLNSKKDWTNFDMYCFAELNKDMKKNRKLINAFILAVENGAQSNPCWVVEYEQENRTDRDAAFYKKMGNFMKEHNFPNINIDFVMEPVVLFSGSTVPVEVNREFYERSCTSAKIVCHHPFLCERNPACVGTKLRKGTTTPEISHCCFRPSHLIIMNETFNTFCTYARKLDLKTLKATY